MKQIALVLIALILVAGSVYYFVFMAPATDVVENEVPTEVTPPTDEPLPVEPDGGIGGDVPEAGPVEQIGTSADGNPITAYHFGDGDKEVVFIGGTHGGYSFNTAALGFELVDYLEANPSIVPDGLRVTVIPVVNPDGLKAVTGATGRFDADAVTANDEARVAGRFNGNNVDINRNFACEWQANATWQNRAVSGGTEAFSEPEARAIRDYVQSQNVDAAVVYYSQAGGVYSSTCKNGIDPVTAELTKRYATAAGYPAYEEFDYYEITGDMVNWFAAEGIPGISVLLTDHENTEWEKNRRGIEAVLTYLAQ